MDAAEKLFKYLGSPRGQLTVLFSPLPNGNEELIVWLRDGYNKTNIPKKFLGYKVTTKKMPNVVAHNGFNNLTLC